MMNPIFIFIFILFYFIKLIFLTMCEHFLSVVQVRICSIYIDIVFAGCVLLYYIYKNCNNFNNTLNILLEANKKNILLYNGLVIVLLTLLYYIISLIIFLPINYFSIPIILDVGHSDKITVFDYPYKKIEIKNNKIHKENQDEKKINTARVYTKLSDGMKIVSIFHYIFITSFLEEIFFRKYLFYDLSVDFIFLRQFFILVLSFISSNLYSLFKNNYNNISIVFIINSFLLSNILICSKLINRKNNYYIRIIISTVNVLLYLVSNNN